MKHPLAHYLPNIERLYKSGWTLQRIADKYEVSRQRVYQLVGGFDWYKRETRHKRIPEGTQCVLDECDGAQFNATTGYCAKHYQRHLVHGDPHFTLKPRYNGQLCVDCEKRPAESTQRCRRCYMRYRYHNDAGYRARRKKAASKWNAKKWRTDEEYRARMKAYREEWRRRRKQPSAAKESV